MQFLGLDDTLDLFQHHFITSQINIHHLAFIYVPTAAVKQTFTYARTLSCWQLPPKLLDHKQKGPTFGGSYHAAPFKDSEQPGTHEVDPEPDKAESGGGTSDSSVHLTSIDLFHLDSMFSSAI